MQVITIGPSRRRTAVVDGGNGFSAGAEASVDGGADGGADGDADGGADGGAIVSVMQTISIHPPRGRRTQSSISLATGLNQLRANSKRGLMINLALAE